MRKLTLFLFLTLIFNSVFAQQVPADVTRTNKTPLTGSNANKQSFRDYNLTAVGNLRIPVVTSFSLNGAKDSIGYISYNTTIQKIGVYKGSGSWDTVSNASSSTYTNGYALKLTANKFSADTMSIDALVSKSRLLAYAYSKKVTNDRITSSAQSQSGVTVVDMHYGALRGRGLNRVGSGDVATYNIASASTKGSMTITLTSNASTETGRALVSEDMIAYMGVDNEWYSAKVASIAGAVITLGSPLEVSVAAGTGNLGNYYDNEAHPNQYGYSALADFIIRQKNQYKVEERINFNTTMGGALKALEPSNSINNTGSSNVLAYTFTSLVALSDGVTSTFNVKNSGYHMMKFVVNTLGTPARMRLVYNGITVDTIFNHNEPLALDIPLIVSSSNTTVTVSLSSTVNNGQIIVNSIVPVLVSSGVSPNLNTGTIVLLGDSWFAQYYLDLRLRQRLPNANIINKGVGGNTSQNMIDRFTADVTPNNPNTVILITGTNDYYQGVTLDQFSYNINKLKQMTANIGSHLVVLTSSVGSADLTPANFNLSRRYANYAKYYDEDIDTNIVRFPDIASGKSIGANAASATVLQTSRTINGIAFNGSSNITIPTGNLQQVTDQGGNTTNTIAIDASPDNIGYSLRNASGVGRWTIRLQGSESGANSGSNLTFVGRTDGGSYLEDWVTINRATGNITASAPPTISGHLVNKGYLDGLNLNNVKYIPTASYTHASPPTPTSTGAKGNEWYDIDPLKVYPTIIYKWVATDTVVKILTDPTFGP